MFEELQKIGYKEYMYSQALPREIEGFNATQIGNNTSNLDLIISNIDPNNNKPFAPELMDLIRLHYLCTSRKVVTILEFGCGYSTKIFDHALASNKVKYEDFVKSNLRKSAPFELHSVDNSKKWIRRTKSNFILNHTVFHFAKVRMTTFNDRICTLYDQIPNISPDLIYLDGPSQFGVIGKVRGITTSKIDRLPMAADILTLEHFLLPGCLIVIDGRTANSRFLKANLQREWRYTYVEEYDQHFFELIEEPLGKLNAVQLSFSKV
jgi:hypothetical protein